MYKNTRDVLDIKNKFTSVDENGNIIEQETINIVQHQVPDQYQVLSKNDFGKTPQRINVGFFNKKTNFRVSSKDSIIAFDRDTSEVCSPSIQDIKENPYKYLMIYKYPFMQDIWNETIDIKLNEIKDTTFDITLDNDFGKYLGNLLQELTKLSADIEIDSLDILTDKYDVDSTRVLVLSKIIQVQNTNKFSINKKILLNSNPSFLMGILEGFFRTKENKYYKVPRTINIYNFSIILNLLSASYSIRSNKETQEESSFIIRFKLPSILDTFENYLAPELFRKHKYYFLPAKIGAYEDFKIKFLKDGICITEKQHLSYKENGFTDIMEQVNNGFIELIPTWDLVFDKVQIQDASKKEGTMYDLIMENDKAHNFHLNNLPMLHNSDGDIMGVIGLFTKEACRDAREHFSAENKLKFKNPVDGNVMNWGVKTDAQVGWYNSTKDTTHKASSKKVSYNEELANA